MDKGITADDKMYTQPVEVSPPSLLSFTTKSPWSAPFTTKSPWSASSTASCYSTDSSRCSRSVTEGMLNSGEIGKMSCESISSSIELGDHGSICRKQQQQTRPMNERCCCCGAGGRYEERLCIPPHPNLDTAEIFQRRKRIRVRTQRVCGVAGGAVGFAFFGPLGMVVGGVTTNRIARVIGKKREKQWQDRYHQRLQEALLMELYILQEARPHEMVLA